jgi:hypothetical protein
MAHAKEWEIIEIHVIKPFARFFSCFVPFWLKKDAKRANMTYFSLQIKFVYHKTHN